MHFLASLDTGINSAARAVLAVEIVTSTRRLGEGTEIEALYTKEPA